MAQPSFTLDRLRIRMRSSVHVNLAPDVRSAFEDHDDALQLRLLDDLHGIGRRTQPRPAGGQTVSFGIIFRVVVGVVIVDSGSPGLEWNPWFRRSATASA